MGRKADHRRVGPRGWFRGGQPPVVRNLTERSEKDTHDPRLTRRRRDAHGHRTHPATMVRAGPAEMIATAIPMFTGPATAGAAALGKSIAGSPPDSLAAALTLGLVLVAVVGALGQVSGAHLNVAVAGSGSLRRTLPTERRSAR